MFKPIQPTYCLLKSDEKNSLDNQIDDDFSEKSKSSSPGVSRYKIKQLFYNWEISLEGNE